MTQPSKDYTNTGPTTPPAAAGGTPMLDKSMQDVISLFTKALTGQNLQFGKLVDIMQAEGSQKNREKIGGFRDSEFLQTAFSMMGLSPTAQQVIGIGGDQYMGQSLGAAFRGAGLNLGDRMDYGTHKFFATGVASISQRASERALQHGLLGTQAAAAPGIAAAVSEGRLKNVKLNAEGQMYRQEDFELVDKITDDSIKMMEGLTKAFGPGQPFRQMMNKAKMVFGGGGMGSDADTEFMLRNLTRLDISAKLAGGGATAQSMMMGMEQSIANLTMMGVDQQAAAMVANLAYTDAAAARGVGYGGGRDVNQMGAQRTTDIIGLLGGEKGLDLLAAASAAADLGKQDEFRKLIAEGADITTLEGRAKFDALIGKGAIRARRGLTGDRVGEGMELLEMADPTLLKDVVGAVAGDAESKEEVRDVLSTMLARDPGSASLLTKLYNIDKADKTVEVGTMAAGFELLTKDEAFDDAGEITAETRKSLDKMGFDADVFNFVRQGLRSGSISREDLGSVLSAYRLANKRLSGTVSEVQFGAGVTGDIGQTQMDAQGEKVKNLTDAAMADKKNLAESRKDINTDDVGGVNAIQVMLNRMFKIAMRNAMKDDPFFAQAHGMYEDTDGKLKQIEDVNVDALPDRFGKTPMRDHADGAGYPTGVESDPFWKQGFKKEDEKPGPMKVVIEGDERGLTIPSLGITSEGYWNNY
jgi:hypothetical protein